MLKKTITYVDYDDNERTEDFYFNLTKAEVVEMQWGVAGGITKMMENILSAQDIPAIARFFKSLILKAYGEKSPDGKRFIKSEELSTAFSQTEAYSQLFVELGGSGEAAADFVNGILPKDVSSGTLTLA